jgi:hypothetical protein
VKPWAWDVLIRRSDTASPYCVISTGPASLGANAGNRAARDPLPPVALPRNPSAGSAKARHTAK